MGAIAKLVSYHNKILSTIFLIILPEFLHILILAICILCKYHHVLATKRSYAAAIESSTFRFSYRKELEADSGECSVCLSEYAEGEECCRLAACGHAFHRRCVERWLKGCSAATCPLCRAEAVPEEVAADYRRLEEEVESGWIEKEFALVLLSALDGGSCNNRFF